MQIQSFNVYHAWKLLLHYVLNEGKECAPRGKKIKEKLGTSVVVTDLRNNIIVDSTRDLNYRFMIAEWLWILAGRNDVATVARYNKPIAAFSDDGITFKGAYGPRLSLQWEYIVRQLERDSDSRQAVASIWTPNPVDSKDYPCTLSAQFLIREAKLHSVWTMRSNDLWLGFPYDFFNFSQITNSLAGRLGVDTGSLTLNAGSSHLYENDWEKVQQLLGEGLNGNFLRSPRLRCFPRAEMMWKKVQNDTVPFPFDFNLDEQRYVEVLSTDTKAQALELLREYDRQD